jgi:hypothetical protein
MPLSQMLGRLGRDGDSMVAHITPQEAEMLRRRGGRGTVNPNTGLREFAKVSREGGGHSAGASVGRGGVAGSGGGSIGKSDGPQKSSGIGARSGSISGSSQKSSSLGGIKEASRFADPKMSIAGTPAAGPAESSFGFDDAMAIGSTLMGIATVNPVEVIGGLASLIGGGMFDDTSGNVEGTGYGSIAKDPDAAMKARFAGSDFGPTGGRGGDRVATGEYMSDFSSALPSITGGGGGGDGEGEGGMPPMPATIPDELAAFLEPGMTDEQIRALIATYGTQSANSYFQSPDVLDYFSSLLRPALGSGGYGAAKPIEHQYLNQTFGLSYAPTVDALLSALGGTGGSEGTESNDGSGGSVKLRRRGPIRR